MEKITPPNRRSLNSNGAIRRRFAQVGAGKPKIGLANSSWANLSSNGVCYCYNNS